MRNQIVATVAALSLMAINSYAGLMKITPTGVVFSDNSTQTSAASGAGDGHSLDAADGSPVDSVFVDNSGNVGIGTTSPEAKLTVYNNELSSNANGQETLRIMGDYSVFTPGSGPYINFTNEAGDTTGAIKSMHDTSGAGRVNLGFFPYNNTPGQLSEAVRIQYNGNVGIGTIEPSDKLSILDGNVRIMNTGVPGRLGLAQAGEIFQEISADHIGLNFGVDTGAKATHMTITNTGNVGIGTIAPTAGLQIDKGATNDFALKLSSSGAGWGSGMVFENTTASTGKSYGIYSGSAGILYFSDINTSLARMIIDPGGNVGIGITNPGAKLEIAGQVKITGGTPGAGKVLTSDAAGLATWDDPIGDSSQWADGTGSIYYNSGNVGIGTDNPATALDINGVMKLAKNSAEPFTCDATYEGAISLTSKFTTCACDGNNWVLTSDGTTSCEWTCDCIAQTGETTCSDNLGNTTLCTSTGQDGEYQNGCTPIVTPRGGYSFGSYNRTSFACEADFTDNGDGTVSDNLTGLIWLKDRNCIGIVGGVDKGVNHSDKITWDNALTWSNNLGHGSCNLTDGSVAGDWRLPNYNELRSLFDPTLSSPYLPSEHPFIRLPNSAHYWSSTTDSSSSSEAWVVVIYDAYTYSGSKPTTNYVWPVRGGQ